jgi:hypothetical protein
MRRVQLPTDPWRKLAPVPVCWDCGAYVHDEQVHRNWHATQQLNLSTALGHLSPETLAAINRSVARLSGADEFTERRQHAAERLYTSNPEVDLGWSPGEEQMYAQPDTPDLIRRDPQPINPELVDGWDDDGTGPTEWVEIDPADGQDLRPAPLNVRE